MELSRALAVDDNGVVDLAGVDHGAREVHAVDEAQTGIGQVEVEAVGRHAELVVDIDRG
jgi:hypothetical protein